MMRVLVSVFCLIPAVLGVDFEVGYLWHLARGQVKLLWQAEPISRVLKREDLAPETREGLGRVLAIRAFAQDSLGLAASRNYTTFVDIGAGPVSWNLTVCPKDKLAPLRWSYPVVGSVPYRGYFAREDAEKARDEYEADGYDTYLRGVSAYSTLGWFPDPVLSTMLRYSEADLADVIIHELTHATVWIADDVTFNESLASFVGEAGAMLWLEDRYGTDSPEIQRVRDARSDSELFRRFMRNIAASLDSLYAEDLSFAEKVVRREAIFDAARLRFAELDLKTNRYQRFPQWQLNNARLALYRVYQERTDIFRRVYDTVGQNLPAALDVFKQCETVEDPARFLEDWLESR